MTEILFSDNAKHYLFSGRITNETYLFTVTPSEVNVIIRISMPPTTMESMLVVQATQLGENGTFILKPVLMSHDGQEPDAGKERIMAFIDDIIDKASEIQKYSANKEEKPEPVLEYLKTGLTSARDNLSNME